MLVRRYIACGLIGPLIVLSVLECLPLHSAGSTVCHFFASLRLSFTGTVAEKLLQCSVPAEELRCTSAAGCSTTGRAASPLLGVLLPGVWNPHLLLLSILFVEIEKKKRASGVSQVFQTHFWLYNKTAQSLQEFSFFAN